MVEPPEKRIEKYKQKLDPDVVRSRLEAQKDLMIEQQIEHLTNIADVQIAVKNILAARGVAPELTIPFMKIALKLYGIYKKHQGTVTASEIVDAINLDYCKYKTYFKTTFPLTDILKDIAGLFGVAWSAPSGCFE